MILVQVQSYTTDDKTPKFSHNSSAVFTCSQAVGCPFLCAFVIFFIFFIRVTGETHNEERLFLFPKKCLFLCVNKRCT